MSRGFFVALLVVGISLTSVAVFQNAFAEPIYDLGGSFVKSSEWYQSVQLSFNEFVIKQGDGDFKILTLKGTAKPLQTKFEKDESAGFRPSDYALYIDGKRFGPIADRNMSIEQCSPKIFLDCWDSLDDAIQWNWYSENTNPVNFEIDYKVPTNISKDSKIELFYSYERYITGVVKEEERKIGELSQLNTKSSSSQGGGCLIATATFDSELAPQVQKLREIRDSKLLQT